MTVYIWRKPGKTPVAFFLTKDNNAFLAWIKSNYVSHFEICHSGFLNLFGNMNFKPTF